MKNARCSSHSLPPSLPRSLPCSFLFFLLDRVPATMLFTFPARCIARAIAIYRKRARGCKARRRKFTGVLIIFRANALQHEFNFVGLNCCSSTGEDSGMNKLSPSVTGNETIRESSEYSFAVPRRELKFFAVQPDNRGEVLRLCNNMYAYK